jgi:hypothetical protein
VGDCCAAVPVHKSDSAAIRGTANCEVILFVLESAYTFMMHL